MPALSSSLFHHAVFTHQATTNPTTIAISPDSENFEVICSWPVSGQYGPGTRFLYYVLITACVFGRKIDWLRSPCLAAALLFPAVAALHGIVLAALHVKDAVDMDIYGAFQLCSIGILAAPVTVKLSNTYFNDPGRNVIFLWTVLVLAGLLSLTVEFYRAHGEISAACCIPAILQLVTMWNRIVDGNRRAFFRRMPGIYGGGSDSDSELDGKSIRGTNGATPRQIRSLDQAVRFLLSVIEIPIFTGMVLGIIVYGEWNFFSRPVRYHTEPMANIGQWAPIVGTGLGAFGSLCMLLAEDDEALKKCEANDDFPRGRPRFIGSYCDCHHKDCTSQLSYSQAMIEREFTTVNGRDWIFFNSDRQSSENEDIGNRRKAKKVLGRVGKFLVGDFASQILLEQSFKRGKASEYPLVPGEEYRKDVSELVRRFHNLSRASSTTSSRIPSTPSSITQSAARTSSNANLKVQGQEIHVAPLSISVSDTRFELQESNRSQNSLNRSDTLKVPERTYTSRSRRTNSLPVSRRTPMNMQSARACRPSLPIITVTTNGDDSSIIHLSK